MSERSERSISRMSDAIAISGLVKTFGRTRALDGLDLTVRQGEVHGFLGPNGAGKATTLRILDEPTSGLDPLMEQVFSRCVEEEKSRGRTVLLSSHILSEVEQLCDRVSIVRAGKTVDSGTLKELRHLTRTTVDAEIDRAPA